MMRHEKYVPDKGDVRVIDRCLLQRVQSCLAREPVPLDDCLGMDFHRDQLFRLSQQFRS